MSMSYRILQNCLDGSNVGTRVKKSAPCDLSEKRRSPIELAPHTTSYPSVFSYPSTALLLVVSLAL
jgi:hypothetical protein